MHCTIWWPERNRIRSHQGKLLKPLPSMQQICASLFFLLYQETSQIRFPVAWPGIFSLLSDVWRFCLASSHSSTACTACTPCIPRTGESDTHEVQAVKGTVYKTPRQSLSKHCLAPALSKVRALLCVFVLLVRVAIVPRAARVARVIVVAVAVVVADGRRAEAAGQTPSNGFNSANWSTESTESTESIEAGRKGAKSNKRKMACVLR